MTTQNIINAWATMAESEVMRLTELKENQSNTFSEKMVWMNLSKMCNGGELSEQGQKCFDYYTQALKYLGIKIMFWEGLVKKQLPHDMLIQLQENMTEWLEKAWEYFGMANFKAEGDEAKDEFDFFKKVCSIVPKKDKKKTRRGGKKHRKKN